MKATVVPQTRGPRITPQTRARGATRANVVEDRITTVEFEGTRVRLLRVTADKGLYEGSPLLVTTTTFLDGAAHRVIVAGGKPLEDEMTVADAVPARTKDVTDFGRLTVAAKQLVKAMNHFGPENPPTPAQVMLFVQSYQNLQAWHEQAVRRLRQSEGEIDTVRTLLSQFLG